MIRHIGLSLSGSIEQPIVDGDCIICGGGKRVAIGDRKDRAQHAPGSTILESDRQGNLPGIGMTIINGVIRTQCSHNTPPANALPEIVFGRHEGRSPSVPP